MKTFTIFTAAYNRPATLQRLYNSLKRQTFQDFLWLIVDDSTTNEVQDAVKEFQNEAIIEINYVRQPHRGKHWAQRRAFSMFETPYMVEIDDDDELTDDCLQTFFDEWQRIESTNRDDIGEIRASVVDADGKMISRYTADTPFLDTNNLEMAWRHNQPSENCVSRKTSAIQSTNLFRDDGKWLYNQTSLVNEIVMWYRFSRKYNARFLQKPLRIFHTESDERQTNSTFNRQKCIDYVFSNYVLVNELRGRQHENLRTLIKYLAEYMVCGCALRLKIKDLLAHIDGFGPKLTCLLLLPCAWAYAKWSPRISNS